MQCVNVKMIKFTPKKNGYNMDPCLLKNIWTELAALAIKSPLPLRSTISITSHHQV